MFNKIFKRKAERRTVDSLLVYVVYPLNTEQCNELAGRIVSSTGMVPTIRSLEGSTGDFAASYVKDGVVTYECKSKLVGEIIEAYIRGRKGRTIWFQVQTLEQYGRLNDECLYIAGVRVKSAMPLGPESIGIPYRMDGEWTQTERDQVQKKSASITRFIEGSTKPLKWIILPGDEAREAEMLSGMLKDNGLNIGVFRADAVSEFTTSGLSETLERECRSLYEKAKRTVPIPTFTFEVSPVPAKGKAKRIKELAKQVETLQELLDQANEKLSKVKGICN